MSEAPGEIEVRDIRAGEEGAAAGRARRAGCATTPCTSPPTGTTPIGASGSTTSVSSFVLEKMAAQEPIVAVDDGVIVGVAGATPLGRCQPERRRAGARCSPRSRASGRGTGLRVVRWTAEWSKHDPAEPHVHLGPVGVDRHLQGQGIGSRLMAEHVPQAR